MEWRSSAHSRYGVAKKDYEDGIEGLTMALQTLRDYYAAGEESFIQLTQPDVGTHSKASGAATGIIGLLEVTLYGILFIMKHRILEIRGR